MTLNLALLSLDSSHNWNTLFVGTNAVADAIAQKYNASKSQVLDHVSWLIDQQGWEITFLSFCLVPRAFLVFLCTKSLCAPTSTDHWCCRFSVGSKPNNRFVTGRQSDAPSPPSRSAFLWLNFAFLHN